MTDRSTLVPRPVSGLGSEYRAYEGNDESSARGDYFPLEEVLSDIAKVQHFLFLTVLLNLVCALVSAL